MKNKLTMLMILDGFGINDKTEGNAIKLANTPCIDKLMNECPTTKIETSGIAVGLPKGQMGNSETGHTNIGAGRIVDQVLTRITNSIENGKFFTIREFNNAIENCKKHNSKLHIMGLLSNGGIHSHNRHLYALLEYAKRKGVDDVFIHCFMDGRDTPPASGEGFLSELQEKLDEKQIGKIATISGRFYAMDRDMRWERTQLAYDAMVNGIGPKTSSFIQAIEDSYQKEVFDEFVIPTVICNSQGEPIAKIEEHDSVIFYNFRPDRARQITRTLVDNKFKEFKTKKLNLYFVTFTRYDETLPNVRVAFKPVVLKNTFGEYISKLGLKQLRIAETEKYAHITIFFNGGEEKIYDGEDVILVNSPNVVTYDLQPEMSANEITDEVINAINEEKYDSIILNYANADMVGHTGNLDATIKAIEVLDECIQKVVDAVKKKKGVLLITANHGNSEQMIDYKTGEPFTSHTKNPVPLIIVGIDNISLKEGKLSDIAPTMLDIMGLKKPEEMTR